MSKIKFPVTTQYDVIVYPQLQPLAGSITAQPSKNYTTRYLLAAGLAEGDSLVSNCALSADSQALQRCLHQMGVNISPVGADSQYGQNLRVRGVAGNPKTDPNVPLNPGNAGAVLRFLLGIGALLPDVTFVTDHVTSLGKRPNQELLDALQQLGCVVESNDGKLPITLRGGNLRGGQVTIDGSRSSQFLSALLFLAPLIEDELRITVSNDLVSKAPIRQTLEVLSKAGIEVASSSDLMSYVVKPGSYRAGKYNVNGDWPGSAALLAAAAVTNGHIGIERLYDDEQGEKRALDVLKAMGAETTISHNDDVGKVTLTVQESHLQGLDFDGDLATDAVLALMGAAALAQGRTRFYNVSNLRLKECDRISEPIAELRKLGVKCWEGHELGDADPDAIIIEGNPDGYEGGITVDGRDDHRVIMLLSIVALRCKNPVRILRAHEVSKSYPAYFEHFQQLGARLSFEECAH